MDQANSVNGQLARDVWRKNLQNIVRIILIAGVLTFLSLTACTQSSTTRAEGENTLPTITPTDTPSIAPTSVPTSIPMQAVYNWAGVMLSLEVPLPENPGEAMLYQQQPGKPATIEQARALAGQFGMQGDMYEIPAEINFNGKQAFLVVDGKHHLRLNGNVDFWYYPDYERYRRQTTNSHTGQPLAQEQANRLIGQFLNSHGFDPAYVVKPGHFYDDYVANLITPDGYEIRHAFLRSPGFSFDFDGDELLSVTASLLEYAPIDRLEIISPETALQRLTENGTIYGVYVFVNSGESHIKNWQRTYPKNETITVWGPVTSLASVDGIDPLITFDGYQVTGNITGLADFPPSTFVEATGQILEGNGIETFNIESWQVRDKSDRLPGDIYKDGDQIVFTNAEGLRLVLPDVPSDLPLPFENAFVRGIIHGEVFEWKYIDNHLQFIGNEQGGGGFASQFHRLNLTGTPVPLATPTINPNNAATETRTNYSGQTGVIELAELAYYLPDPNMVLHGLETTEPVYIQPVWRFYGHLSGGDEFEVLVQAVEDEFLSPELEPVYP